MISRQQQQQQQQQQKTAHAAPSLLARVTYWTSMSESRPLVTLAWLMMPLVKRPRRKPILAVADTMP